MRYINLHFTYLLTQEKTIAKKQQNNLLLTSSGQSCSAFAKVPLALWVRSRK